MQTVWLKAGEVSPKVRRAIDELFAAAKDLSENEGESKVAAAEINYARLIAEGKELLQLYSLAITCAHAAQLNQLN